MTPIVYYKQFIFVNIVMELILIFKKLTLWRKAKLRYIHTVGLLNKGHFETNFVERLSSFGGKNVYQRYGDMNFGVWMTSFVKVFPYLGCPLSEVPL